MPRGHAVGSIDIYALTDSDPEPCWNCRNVAKCATAYACNQFMQWTISGRDKKELLRVPERGRYARLLLEAATIG